MLSIALTDTFAGACVNIDNGETDKGGFSCEKYTTLNSKSYCGNWDDQDFDSKNMCCKCGGGKAGKYSAVV